MPFAPARRRRRPRSSPSDWPSVSKENSRPPMKRADGTGSPSALTLTSVVARRIELVLRCRRPPSTTTHVPVETTEKGGPRCSRCGRARRWNRGCRRTPASRRQAVVRRAMSGRMGPSRSLGLAAPAPSADASPSRRPETEKSAVPRVPQIGVAAERRHLVGGDAGQPQGPVLRIRDDRRRPWRTRAERFLPAR